VLLFVPLALAHPGSAPGASGKETDYIGHRVELTVAADTAELRYVAEVPERRVLAEAAGTPGYGTKLLEELAGEVRLTWNGAVLDGARIRVEDPVKAGEAGFLDFAVGWQADLPADEGRLGVRIGSFPGDPSFFATSVTLDGSWMADATSLLKVKGGRVRDNWHGAWVKDESAREPWVDLRRAGFFERSATPAPLPRRMTGVEGDAPSFWVIGVLALTLLPVAWLGRKLGQRARR
jgi:hypothetical protein